MSDPHPRNTQRPLVLACLLALGLRLSAPSSAYAGTNGSNGAFGGAGGTGSNPGTNDGGAGPWNAPGGSGSPAGIGGGGGAVSTGGAGGTSAGGGRGADGGAYAQAGWLVGGGGGAGGGFTSSGLGGGGGGGGSAYATASYGGCTFSPLCKFGGSSGGGGGGLGKEIGGSYVNAGTISGGNGGNGGPIANLLSCNGLAAGGCSGGGGGGGGAGVLLDASAALTNSGYIHGGIGGSTGTGYRAVSSPPVGVGVGGRGGGGAGVLMSAGSSLTNTGSIRGGIGGSNGSTTNGGYGGTGVFAAGNASIVNAGSIRGGNGSNAVSLTGGGNTLQLNSGYRFSGNVVSDGSGAGDTLALGGAGNAAFDLSTVGSLYQGFARFAKKDASTWMAANVASRAMTWAIDAGTLELDGSLPIAGSAIAVNSGGTLSGTGGLTGDLSSASGATVAPGTGAASGALTIAGNVIENAGSTLLIHADNAGHNSELVVTSGTATLGGTLNLSFTAPPPQGQLYTVLSGNVSGKFAAVSATGLGAGNGLYVTYGSVKVMIGPSLAITSPASTTFEIGRAGSFAMTKANPDFPASTCSEIGALPAGITFDPSTCTLGGTAAAGTSGTYSISLDVSNSVDPDVTQAFALNVVAAAAPVPVPTLSARMLALLGVLMAACGAIFDRRRRRG